MTFAASRINTPKWEQIVPSTSSREDASVRRLQRMPWASWRSLCSCRDILQPPYADTDEVWMRAKQIHTFTGATKIGHTLERVDEEDKCSLKEIIRCKGVLPKVGSLNDPTPNQEEYHEGKAIYINEPGFYTIVLGSKSRVATQLGSSKMLEPTLHE